MAVNIGPKVALEGWAEFKKDMNAMIQQQKTLKSEMELVTAGFDKHTSAQKRAKAQAEVLSKQVQVQRQRVDKLKEGLEQSRKEFGENDTRTRKWEQAVNEANTELKKMEAQLKDTTTQTSRFRTAIDKAGDGLHDLPKKLGNGLKSIPKTLGTGLKTVTSGAIKVVGGLTVAAASGVVALGKIGIDYNKEMESYTTNFETMLGSAEAAAQKVDALKKMAASTPFEMTDLADATQQLLAMGVANEDTNKFLQQLGDISLGNAEKFNSLVGAFGKMNSSQKVTLEYINIMAEQGFNPLNLIAQKTGESMTDLYKRVSAGKVSFQEVKDAIATATSQGGQFYKGMEKASKTTDGLIATLKDNATALVGQVFQPISDGIVSYLLPKAIGAIDQLTVAFEKDGVAGMVGAAGSILGETIGEFTKGLPKFAGIAVDIIGNLLAGLKSNLGTISDGATETVLTLADGIIELLPEIVVIGAELLARLGVGIIQAIPDLILRIPEMIQRIVTGFSENSAAWEQIGKDLIDGLWRGLKSGWTVITGWAKDAASWIGGLFSGSGSSGEFNIDGSHAGGLSYVPWDGYIAQLHKGEMVLTRAQAQAMRTASPVAAGVGSVNYGGFSFHIYAQPGQDEQQIADVVMDRIQTEIERKGAAW